MYFGGQLSPALKPLDPPLPRHPIRKEIRVALGSKRHKRITKGCMNVCVGEWVGDQHNTEENKVDTLGPGVLQTHVS